MFVYDHFYFSKVVQSTCANVHFSNKEFDEHKVIYNLHKINLEKFSTVFKQ